MENKYSDNILLGIIIYIAMLFFIIFGFGRLIIDWLQVLNWGDIEMGNIKDKLEDRVKTEKLKKGEVMLDKAENWSPRRIAQLARDGFDFDFIPSANAVAIKREI